MIGESSITDESQSREVVQTMAELDEVMARHPQPRHILVGREVFNVFARASAIPEIPETEEES